MPDSTSDRINYLTTRAKLNLLKGLLAEGLGLAGSSAVFLTAGPSLRYLRTGEFYPRYLNTYGFYQPMNPSRESIRSVAGFPLRILIQLAVAAAANRMLTRIGEEDFDFYDRHDLASVRTGDESYMSLPRSSALASLVSVPLSVMLTEPLTRYMEYGRAYPIYLTTSDQEVRHRLLDDLLHGLLTALPRAATREYSFSRVLESAEDALEAAGLKKSK